MKVLIVLALTALAAAQLNVDLGQVFDSLDANKDHFMTLPEMMAYFTHGDTNGNGKVSFEEYAAGMTAAERSSPEVKGPFNYYDKMDGSLDHALKQSDITLIFNKLDSNKDSKVSRHEFLTGYAQIGAEMQTEIDALKSPVGK